MKIFQFFYFFLYFKQKGEFVFCTLIRAYVAKSLRILRWANMAVSEWHFAITQCKVDYENLHSISTELIQNVCKEIGMVLTNNKTTYCLANPLSANEQYLADTPTYFQSDIDAFI